jgi:hypothetical protein
MNELLVKLFIKTRKFLMMHQVIQNSIISDRLSIAFVLCELGSCFKKTIHEGNLNLLLDIFIAECLAYMGECYYTPAFQLGIDMLNRLRHQVSPTTQQTPSDEYKLHIENLIFTYHIRNFKILECIEMLENRNIKLSMNNLESLLLASNNPCSNYSFKKMLNYFSMKQTRDKLLGSTEKFDDIMNRITKQTAFINALTQGTD